MTTASFNPLGTAAAACLAQAFVLWKFDSLADPGAARGAQQAASAATAAAPAVLLHQIRETAKAEGYQAGLAAGHAEGRCLADAEAAHLSTLLDSVNQAVSRLQDEVGTSLLALAFDIARQVLRTELATQPEAVLPAVREALDLADNVSAHRPGSSTQAQLLLCPADAALVRERLHDLLIAGQWRVTEDPAIAAGGCRILTGSGAIDATLTTRWQRIADVLGHHPSEHHPSEHHHGG